MEPSMKNSVADIALYQESMESLSKLLEDERQAIIKGEAETVARLAPQKESQVALVSRLGKGMRRATLPPNVLALMEDVSQRVVINHQLIQQMYQHYHAMMQLFRRIAGQSQTYGPDGMVSIEPGPMKSSKTTV